MSTWGNNQRVCASCRWWGGKREIEFTATFYDADGEGKCHCPNGGFRGCMMNMGASCSEWQSYRG